VLYNAKGENISKAVLPEIEPDITSKEVVAWYKAMLAGEGPVRANMPENYIAQFSERAFHSDGVAVRPITTAFWKLTIGKAMAAAKNRGPMQEVIPGFIGEQSPVRVDHQMATSLSGLFAVGDVAAAGAAWAGAVPAPPGRMRGGGMMGAMWMAMRGGPAAAAQVTAGQRAMEPIADVAQAEILKERMFAPLKRAGGAEPLEFIRAIQDVMSPVGNGIYKREDRLNGALDKVLVIKAKLPRLYAKDWHYLSASNEVEAMVNSAEMFFRASLLRKESRGWHIREDYPDRDDKNWLKWIIVRDRDGDMVLATEDVPIERYPLKPKRP
jgi:succinate dehydrogenase/fumarate reductase flavoprotein subunit